jgi:TPR repeat protein
MAYHTRITPSRLLAAAILAVASVSLAGCTDGHAEVVKLRTTCKSGTAADCNALGDRYRAGHNVLRDETEALRLFTVACDGNVGMGCSSLGLMHLGVPGIKRDSVLARSLLDKGCTRGAPAGCAHLGRLMVRDTGSRRDITRAAALLTQACDGNEPLGCAELGTLLVEGDGVPSDPVRARELFTRGCTEKVIVGCTGLAGLHATGMGVAPNDSISKELYTRSCKEDAVACVQLGLFAQQGRGGPVNFQRASWHFQSACNRRNGEGCYLLSVMHETGAGEYRSAERAKDLRTQACSYGYRAACPKPKAAS